MSYEEDELDNNPFFRAIQTTYLQLYEKAQEKRHMICVPQTSSLEGIQINKTFVETHILKASPYFKGQYLTLNSCSKTLKLEGGVLQTKEGFSQNIEVKIINEELAYNKDYKQYKILILQHPLDPSYHPKQSIKKTTNEDLYTPKLSLEECKTFLKAFPEYSEVILNLSESITQFNNTYMVLTDYLEDTATRLRQMSSNTIDKCIKCTKHNLYSDVKFRHNLSGVIESYIMGSVHQKVYPVVCNRCDGDDRHLSRQCRQLSGVTPLDLGVSQAFSCPLPSAVVELATLDGLRTPRAKQLCLKATVDNVTEGLNAFMLENQKVAIHGQTRNSDAILTSDDLIPILVTVIAQAKCSHLQSDLFYMENFAWDCSDMDNVSYCLVTFKAAVEYMMTENFSKLLPCDMTSRNEISIEDLMSATTSLTVEDPMRPDHTRSTNNRSPHTASRMDRQLQRISKILKESVDELPKVEKLSTAPKSVFGYQPEVHLASGSNTDKQSNGKSEELGEFLSALQDDDFDQPFGKQI